MAQPPIRHCYDCGRRLGRRWPEVVRCKPGQGCRKTEPPRPPQQGTIPF